MWILLPWVGPSALSSPSAAAAAAGEFARVSEAVNVTSDSKPRAATGSAAT
eukprot:CAMPEP_0175020830 /NCGR_PEP_ID=MMETSP0005-20121125/14358_1 /TAXON_ID=420556 /ORGANISM="Ochromonas sp., Strain CCMP1393" /LENGTH=50 /DNA_ID=CAMNT_0016278773 /DNA_START=702 /DNA_END=850 /DNA_ORIENTATION=-